MFNTEPQKSRIENSKTNITKLRVERTSNNTDMEIFTHQSNYD
jgi:hypothetical protein